MPLNGPASGQSIHIEAILALNEKRIGDIYLTMGNKDEARAAYIKTRIHCDKALASTRRGTYTHKEVKKILSQIPTTDASLRLR